MLVTVLAALLGTVQPRVLQVSVDGPVRLGDWHRAPMGLVLRQFEAKPGEVFRIDVRWTDPKGKLTLEAWSGTLDEDDLDDATNEYKVPKVGPVSGAAHLKIAVPPHGNAIWFRVLMIGDAKQMIEYRILATQGAPRDETPCPGTWGPVPTERPEVKLP